MRTRHRARLETLERKDRYRRRVEPVAPFLVLAVTLAVGVTLGVLHNRWRAQNRPDPVLAGVRLAIFPFQYAGARAGGVFSTVGDWLFGGKRLSDQNRRLRAEIARLKQENQALRADAAEAARLREQLGFSQKVGRPLLAAQVIGQFTSPLFDTITVARGARDGVTLSMVARTPDGLVGQVSDVSALSSQVLLLTDANSGVGGMVVRGGKIQGVGIVQGGGRTRPLQIVYLKREDDIRIGDLVVSSGYGGVVPANIPVGRVTAVAEDRARFLKSAQIRPATALLNAREVFLLR